MLLSLLLFIASIYNTQDAYAEVDTWANAYAPPPPELQSNATLKLQNGAELASGRLSCDGRRQAFAVTTTPLSLGGGGGGRGAFSVSFWYRLKQDAAYTNDFQYILSSGAIPGAGAAGSYLHVALPPHTRSAGSGPRRMRVFISSDPSATATGQVDYVDVMMPSVATGAVGTASGFRSRGRRGRRGRRRLKGNGNNGTAAASGHPRDGWRFLAVVARPGAARPDIYHDSTTPSTAWWACGACAATGSASSTKGLSCRSEMARGCPSCAKMPSPYRGGCSLAATAASSASSMPAPGVAGETFTLCGRADLEPSKAFNGDVSCLKAWESTALLSSHIRYLWRRGPFCDHQMDSPETVVEADTGGAEPIGGDSGDWIRPRPLPLPTPTPRPISGDSGDGAAVGVSGSKLDSGGDGSVEYIGVAQWVSRRYALPLLVMVLGYLAWRWRNGRGRPVSGEWYDGVAGAGGSWFESLGLVPLRNSKKIDGEKTDQDEQETRYDGGGDFGHGVKWGGDETGQGRGDGGGARYGGYDLSVSPADETTKGQPEIPLKLASNGGPAAAPAGGGKGDCDLRL